MAKIISDLVNGGKIFDKGVERPIKYSDFLLLLWNTTQMEFYSMVLTDRGIHIQCGANVLKKTIWC